MFTADRNIITNGGNQGITAKPVHVAINRNLHSFFFSPSLISLSLFARSFPPVAIVMGNGCILQHWIRAGARSCSL